MANRNVMSFVMGSPISSLPRPNGTRVTPVARNKVDDRVFASMHRNKANFSVEKVGAVFANLPRRKIG